jgi:hypothetical protein
MGAIFTPATWSLPAVWRTVTAAASDGSLTNQNQELIRETEPAAGHRFWTLSHRGILLCGCAQDPGGPEVRRSGIAQSDGYGDSRQAAGKVHKRSFGLEIRVVENFCWNRPSA